MRTFSPFRSASSFPFESSSHELPPLHHSHNADPRSTSILNPPPLSLARSAYPSISPSSISDNFEDTLHAVRRQTAHLQRSLQALLDAQSAGLITGLGGQAQDEVIIPSEQTRVPTLLEVDTKAQGNLQVPYSDREDGEETASESSTSTTRKSFISHPLSPRGGKQEDVKIGKNIRSDASATLDKNSAIRFTDIPSSYPRAYSPNTQRSLPLTRPLKAKRPPKTSAPPPISLRKARAGILSNLHHLSSLKAHESQILTVQLSGYTRTISDLDVIEAKKAGIVKHISAIEADPQDGRDVVEALEAEERDVQREIGKMEERLSEMRARLERVRRERDTKMNGLEARLSSWRGQLEELDKTITNEYLDPYRGKRQGGRGKRGALLGKENVWALPLNRRTLALVRESVEDEKASIEARIRAVEREEEACSAGVNVWAECVGAVEGVEGRLKFELGGMGSPSSEGWDRRHSATGLEEDGAGASVRAKEERGLEGLLQHMATVISTLSRSLQLAEEQDWKLLVCAVGAELEALREGREMLVAALEQSGLMGDLDGRRPQGGKPTIDIVATPSEDDVLNEESGIDETALLHSAEEGGRAATGMLGQRGGATSTIPSSPSQSFHTAAGNGRGMGEADSRVSGNASRDEASTSRSATADMAELQEHEGGVERSEDEDDAPGLEFFVEQGEE
ncbi:hypothetical protein MMC19_000843 [Ptychographa xylographoides]|nr:hypothetical protein [Ptychographa xylographoides]